MATFVSMLRGINVGGQKKIQMTQLATLYKTLGLKNVETYIQSGNVIFDSSDEDSRELSTVIEERIEQVFNLDVAVSLRTPDELHQIIRNNPFLKEKDVDTDRLYITFLSNAPVESALSQTKEINGEPDRFILSNKEIYLYCPNGYAKTKFSNDFFEKKLGFRATTRNWKTVNTLLDIVNSQTRVAGK